jgi:RNA polymerase primary sigma factor
MGNFHINQVITDRQDASLSLFFKDITRYKVLTLEEELDLADKIKQGDKKALDRLVSANLRFAVSVAKQYQGKGIPLVDLIQEASKGLIEAAKKYDASKGFKFISYAIWWIRQAITQALTKQSRTVRVPMNQVLTYSKINKASNELEQQNCRFPSNEEIANKMDMDVDKINLTMASITHSTSLNTPIKADEVGCLEDLIPNANAEDSDQDIIDKDLSKELNVILDRLPYRESDVVRMYFGLGTIEMTLDEISYRLGVTYERVRQLYRSGINILKNEYGDDIKQLFNDLSSR